MGFRWDLASRIFLAMGAVLLAVGIVLWRQDLGDWLYPAALGTLCLLAAFAMAYSKSA